MEPEHFRLRIPSQIVCVRALEELHETACKITVDGSRSEEKSRQVERDWEYHWESGTEIQTNIIYVLETLIFRGFNVDNRMITASVWTGSAALDPLFVQNESCWGGYSSVYAFESDLLPEREVLINVFRKGNESAHWYLIHHFSFQTCFIVTATGS